MNLITDLRPPGRRALAAAALLLVAWNLCAWVLVERYYVSRADALIAEEQRLTEIRARDLAGSIRRNLHYISGVPEVIAQSREVSLVLGHRTVDAAPSGGADKRMIERWKTDPALQALDRYLAIAQGNLDVDILYVANRAGDVIAASDWNRAGLSIGTSVVDREYFKSARDGRRKLQYAIGKSTGVPGLFFSSPVMAQGRFAGAVVAKIHMPNLSFLLDQSDAFLTDANGVIIMAHNRALEMQVLPGAPIGAVDEHEKNVRYHRSSFAQLPIAPWSYGGGHAPVLLGTSTVPSVLAMRAIPEYGLQAHVNSEIAAIPANRVDQWRFSVLLAVSGSLLIVMLGAAIAYLRAAARAKARLWKQAHFDTLTGLPNRDLFRQRLTDAVGQARDSGAPMALLLGDIDGFKEINDTLGHDAGDLVLQHAAQQIASCVRQTDTVARLGGDEFTVVLPAVGNAQRATQIAQEIVARLAAPFPLLGKVARLSASVGVAFFPEDAGDIEALLKRADQAMYAAKQQGGNRHARFGAAAPALPL